MIEILGYIFASILVLIAGFILYVLISELIGYLALNSSYFSEYKTRIYENLGRIESRFKVHTENSVDLRERIRTLEARLENLEPKDKGNEC